MENDPSNASNGIKSKLKYISSYKFQHVGGYTTDFLNFLLDFSMRLYKKGII